MHFHSVFYYKSALLAFLVLTTGPFDISHSSEVREAKARNISDANAVEQDARQREIENTLHLINSGKLPAPEPQGPKVVLLSHAAEIALDSAISHYEGIVTSGGWRAIPSGPPLQNGDRNARVLALRNRLQNTGDLPANDRSIRLYDAQVEMAVMRFQTRHGLHATAIADGRTITAMNVPAGVRLKQLQLNRDRLHGLLSPVKKTRRIVVNIPAYELHAIGADSEIKLRVRVIVGKMETPTPDLVANIRALNFFPYWHVPSNVVRSDLMPMLLKGTSFLKEQQIRLYKNWKEVNPSRIAWNNVRLERYVFRQDPGPNNALGVLRFDMPNRHTVYMHDTPNKLNFRFSVRASSAGCVRVANAPALARWILETRSDQPENQIAAILKEGKQKTIRTSKLVPVFFVYITAWSAGDNAVQFREDIYNRDGLGYRTADYGIVRKTLPTRAGSRLNN